MLSILAAIPYLLSILRENPAHRLAIPPLILLSAALLAPSLFRLPEALLMKVGTVIQRIVTPILFGIVFIFAFVVFRLARRVFSIPTIPFGFDPSRESYWEVRDPGLKQSFTRQF